MSRVVVAGGAGFIGSHVCEALILRGDEVVCLDDMSTGNIQNLANVMDDPQFTLAVTDITQEIPFDGQVDCVVNLASPASPAAYQARPLETLAAGSEGTRRLLDLAETGNARFVMASTSEIYGEPDVHPQPESYWGNVDPIGLRSVYDEAKRYAETLTMAMHRARGVDVGIARIFNTYGPRLSPGDGRVVSNFIVQALSGSPITIYGDGTQTRSLCYIDDEVRGLLALMDSSVTGPINLGNPDERRILDLAEEVLALTGSSSKLEFQPLPSGDPTRRCPDITLARSLLHWEPHVALEEGLKRCIHYFSGLAGMAPPSKVSTGQSIN